MDVSTATTLRHCPNCTSTLDEGFSYCPRCGQPTHLHRFNLPHIGHELFHAFTHADKGVLFLVKELALRPGRVAREYILEGKRKKYFNPFTFLLLVLGITLFVNSIIHPYTNPAATAGASTSVTAPEKPLSADAARRERIRTAMNFLEKKNNLVVFLAIPITAFVFWLFFIRTRIHYAEHLVAQVFFAGFYSLVTALVLTPLVEFLPDRAWFSRSMLLFQLVYLTIAYYQFLNTNRPSTLFKTALATLLALGAWFIFSGGAVSLYIAFG